MGLVKLHIEDSKTTIKVDLSRKLIPIVSYQQIYARCNQKKVIQLELDDGGN